MVLLCSSKDAGTKRANELGRPCLNGGDDAVKLARREPRRVCQRHVIYTRKKDAVNLCFLRPRFNANSISAGQCKREQIVAHPHGKPEMNMQDADGICLFIFLQNSLLLKRRGLRTSHCRIGLDIDLLKQNKSHGSGVMRLKEIIKANHVQLKSRI